MNHTLIAIFTSLVFLSLAHDASARDRSRAGTFQGGRGREGAFQQQIHREPGQASRDTAVQTERGATTRNVNRAWDRDAGAATRSQTNG